MEDKRGFARSGTCTYFGTSRFPRCVSILRRRSAAARGDDATGACGLSYSKRGERRLSLMRTSSVVKRQSALVCFFVSAGQSSSNFPPRRLLVRVAAIQALGGQNAQLGLRHVQPTAMLGCVVPFEALHEQPGLSGSEGFVSDALACVLKKRAKGVNSRRVCNCLPLIFMKRGQSPQRWALQVYSP